MKIINGFKVNMYVRIGDQPPKNWEEFTKEEQREISQKLNEQAARSFAIKVKQTAESVRGGQA